MFLAFLKTCRAALALALPLMLLSTVNAAFAAPAGQVEFAQGLASAQQRGQTPRFLNKGDVLQEGDVLNTGAKGFAIIQFPDGGKMTLRPNTTFAIDQFNATAGQVNHQPPPLTLNLDQRDQAIAFDQRKGRRPIRIDCANFGGTELRDVHQSTDERATYGLILPDNTS